MFAKLKARVFFDRIFRRKDINEAYKMVGPEDSWYDTITKVHNSLAEIRKLPHETWRLQSHDGLALNAVYYPCSGSNKTVIWVHGYTSHAERESAYPSLFYRSLGYNVLIPYLRAHGPSEGKYICFGPLEAMDIQGWVEKINALHPEGSIVIHGLSMGGGIVLDLACRDMPNVTALVADAPSVSLDGLLHDYPVSVFKKGGEEVSRELFIRYQKVFGVDAQGCDRVENIRNGKYPLLLSAGSNEDMDEVLQRIQVRSPMETQVLILPGCSHGNGMYKQTEMYQGAIKEFLYKHGSANN